MLLALLRWRVHALLALGPVLRLMLLLHVNVVGPRHRVGEI